MGHFAVIDLETTGISTSHHHRIVEIAIVLLDKSGKEVETWSTLVNPKRDVSATEIHGITASDIFAAPSFEDIAGEIASLLKGNVPVSHNYRFDSGFLSAEFARIGWPVPLGSSIGLCTMNLAGQYLNCGRSLAACCEMIGYSIEDAHSALADAKAAANLLQRFLQQDLSLASSWSEIIGVAEKQEWPEIPKRSVSLVTRSHVAKARDTHFLSRLASRSPRDEIFPAANSYLALLDQALMDRLISLHEEAQLLASAEMLGLSREEATICHHRYLRTLAQVALSDGVVTVDEQTDLSSVAKLLGLTNYDVELALSMPVEALEMPLQKNFRLYQGDAVVITGEDIEINRGELEALATQCGLKLTKSASGKTKLVIAGDPDSQSGKARKGRELGIPIVNFACGRDLIEKIM